MEYVKYGYFYWYWLAKNNPIQMHVLGIRLVYEIRIALHFKTMQFSFTNRRPNICMCIFSIIIPYISDNSLFLLYKYAMDECINIPSLN